MSTHRARSSSFRGASGRPSPRRTALCSLLLLVAPPLLAGGQNLPPPSQAQQALQQAVQQNPALADLIRQRIGQSGMTAEQIRARLQAAGYPPTLLDAYLGAATPGQAASLPGAQELAAVEALGLPPVATAAELLPVDTGLVRAVAGGKSAVFGVDVFQRTTTQFLPLLSGPVPADYKLGPGDVLVLILTGDVELAYTLQVTREGFVLIPQVGQVFVANLTLDQLRGMLYTRLGRVYSGVRRGPGATTHFDISVANVRVNQVYVVGEVGQPGAYQISSLGTVLTALYAAGGVTERANMRRIEVRRAGKAAATVDLYDYLLRGDTRSDVRLETGDVVFVPVHATRVQITGAVRRPAIYDMAAGESLAQLVDDAGGFRPEAQLRRLTIHRILAGPERGASPSGRVALDVPLTAVQSAAHPVTPLDPAGPVAVPALALQDGDSVVVDFLPPVAGGYYVGIAGMVMKPGQYPWQAGMTLRDLVVLAGGPKVGADLEEAEVARLPADRAHGQLATTLRVPLDSTYLLARDSLGRYVGPPGVPVPPAGAPEVPLQPYDNVLILRQPDFEFQRVVEVTGEVRYPGAYSLHTKTDRLADVIARAGGLTPRAYAAGIRFVRSTNDVGRINVELKRALQDTTSSFNIILQPGDSIYVPEYQAAVKVVGAVNSPGSVLWQQGRDLGYYLSAAGGLTYNADRGRVSVRYANGEVRTRHTTLFFHSEPAPGPGSEVVVPLKDTSNPTNKVALLGAIAQILASTVAIIAIATKL